MKVGFIGLGKMGAGLFEHARESGVDVSSWNRSPNSLATVATVEELVGTMRAGERVVWLMLPAGPVVDEFLAQLLPLLTPGDTVIDGGNSHYPDTLRRGKILTEKHIHFLDVGVSGGPSGARHGACLMIGGERSVFESLSELWIALAAPDSYRYLGDCGAGHFAKMVHNGIEYGMMQAIAEGAATLAASPFHIDLSAAFDIYNHNSVITSRLVGWTQEALTEDPALSHISSKIDHTGEGEWTVEAAKEFNIETPIIAESLEVRKRSTAESDSFRDKVVSAMRGKFGGHKVAK